jgi:TetR/AcrR family transcriptional repressor of nem operon
LPSLAKSRKEETRSRIIETASRLFQEKGVDGVGVDEIMRESGLTHGGFYAHFASKEALVSEACLCAMDRSFDKWTGVAQRIFDDQAFQDFLSAYMGGDPKSVNPACPMAMLGPDIARRGPMQSAYIDRMNRLIDLIMNEMDCDRDHAVMALASMIGATSLATAAGEHKDFVADILSATRRGLMSCTPQRGVRRKRAANA